MTEYQLHEAVLAARRVRQERVAWLFVLALWVCVWALAMEATQR